MSKIKDLEKKNKQTKQQHETSSKQAGLTSAGFTPSGLKGRGSRVGPVLAVSLDKSQHVVTCSMAPSTYLGK